MDQEEQEQAQQQEPEQQESDISTLAIALGLAVFGLVCALFPTYAGVQTGSLVFYVLICMAGLFSLVGFVEVIIALSELGILTRLFGGNQDAWTYLTIAIFFLVLVAGVHWIAIIALSVTGVLKFFAQGFILILLALAVLMGAASADEFVIKPAVYNRTELTLEQKAERKSRRRGLIGVLATVILWVATLVASVLQIIDLLSLDSQS